MPTRLEVRLHMRKSARAGPATRFGAMEATSATAASPLSRLRERVRVRLRAALTRTAAPDSTLGSQPEGRLSPVSRKRNSADEDDAAVIDIRSCRPGHQEVAQTLEKICRIIV